MVENAGLDGFIIIPDRRIGKAIYFNRQAVGARIKLPDEYRGILNYIGVVLQISFNINAERPDIGHPAMVGISVIGVIKPPVPFIQFLFLAGQIILKQADTMNTLHFLIRHEVNARLVNIYGTP